MKKIQIKARKATPELMEELEKKGVLRRLRPSQACLTVPEGEQVVEQVELAKEGTGPWQTLAVACNRTKLDHLAAHGDIESWLYFSAEPTSKPLLYVVAVCSSDEFERKAADGALEASDLVALEIMPNDPATSFFTVPGGIFHDELTYPGPGVGPVFFVPEPSVMGHKSVPLDNYEFTISKP